MDVNKLIKLCIDEMKPYHINMVRALSEDSSFDGIYIKSSEASLAIHRGIKKYFMMNPVK